MGLKRYMERMGAVLVIPFSRIRSSERSAGRCCLCANLATHSCFEYHNLGLGFAAEHFSLCDECHRRWKKGEFNLT